MEAHEPYHSLPVSEWDRAAAKLQAEERRSGHANYAAVPPARLRVMHDESDERSEAAVARIGQQG